MQTTEGTHLSIGEVLSLLTDDFPDVTISKIRFLESQGLIDPERTPSGYRKFYDSDIARLRWILRQQRDHFLPLKVIKAKMDDGTADVGDEGPAEPNLFTALDSPVVPPASTAGGRIPAGQGGRAQARQSFPGAGPTRRDRSCRQAARKERPALVGLHTQMYHFKGRVWEGEP